jgi:hypothetical protein
MVFACSRIFNFYISDKLGLNVNQKPLFCVHFIICTVIIVYVTAGRFIPAMIFIVWSGILGLLKKFTEEINDELHYVLSTTLSDDENSTRHD